MVDLLQVVGTLLLTHSLWWWRPTMFSTMAGMATPWPSRSTISLWLARLGLMLYLLGYAVKYVRVV